MAKKSIDIQKLGANPESLLTLLENEQFVILTLQDVPVAKVFSVEPGASENSPELHQGVMSKDADSHDPLSELGRHPVITDVNDASTHHDEYLTPE